MNKRFPLDLSHALFSRKKAVSRNETTIFSETAFLPIITLFFRSRTIRRSLETKSGHPPSISFHSAPSNGNTILPASSGKSMNGLRLPWMKKIALLR